MRAGHREVLPSRSAMLSVSFRVERYREGLVHGWIVVRLGGDRLPQRPRLFPTEEAARSEAQRLTRLAQEMPRPGESRTRAAPR